MEKDSSISLLAIGETKQQKIKQHEMHRIASDYWQPYEPEFWISSVKKNIPLIVKSMMIFIIFVFEFQ